MPALVELKLAAATKLTLAASVEMTPDIVPAVTEALLLPSYTLLATTVPETVIAFGVMFILTPLGCVSK